VKVEFLPVVVCSGTVVCHCHGGGQAIFGGIVGLTGLFQYSLWELIGVLPIVVAIISLYLGLVSLRMLLFYVYESYSIRNIEYSACWFGLAVVDDEVASFDDHLGIQVALLGEIILKVLY
jgi:hypothetical protein